MKRYVPTVLLSLLMLTGAHAAERIELQGTVRGNQEQPGVLFLIPWQNPPSPDIRTERPAPSLKGLDAPIERERFRQQLYFRDHLELGEPDTHSSQP
ncbi:MAG: hypothetical protein D6758_00070 [Gammaproteobacteria bacterium]|nr:MAG: hypothetical protein D6758_00070 [Gammaproteobacteria bacterium]